MTETTVQQQVRLLLEAKCRELADLLKSNLPEAQGFALFLFDYGADGNTAYVSTAERATMVEAIEEWLEKTREEHEDG